MREIWYLFLRPRSKMGELVATVGYVREPASPLRVVLLSFVVSISS